MRMRSVEDGVWIDPADAAERISAFKPRGPGKSSRCRGRPSRPAGDGDGGRTHRAVELYRLYETRLEDTNRLDFDDLITRALRVLRADAVAREYWQAQYDCAFLV